MKVLYLIDSLEGYGAEKSLVQIAQNLKKAIPVFVHLYRGETLKPVLENNGIRVYSLNINAVHGYRKALELLEPIIADENPDIIHSTLFRADMVARKLKEKYPNIPLVGSFVSNSYGKKRYRNLSPLSRIKLFITQWRDRKTVHKVDYFICNSEAIKETNTRALKVPREKVKVIYRGRCLKDFNIPEETAVKLKQRLNLREGKIFLNVGRFNKGKGQLDLLKAFKLLVKSYPDVNLLIAGEGGLRNKLEQLTKDLGLQDNVHLLGYREDIPELLAISDFFVFPSYFEGLPGALIEAIISKKPSIVSSIPENRECFNKDGALFFEPGNIRDLSCAMKEALSLQDWEEKTAASLEHAKERFDIRIVSREYDKFYAKILSDRPVEVERL